MYLIDTNVLSELRKKQNANPGVIKFMERAIAENAKLYISVVTLGELRRGVELIRHRSDTSQAAQLEKWLNTIIDEYGEAVLNIDADIAQLWGKLRSPNPEHAIDKLIAATAMIHSLTVVTRNTKDFSTNGLQLLNPFE